MNDYRHAPPMSRPRLAGIGLAAILSLFTLAPATAFAVPALQLDILGGRYDQATQTVVASSSVFTLYAYLTPDEYGHSQLSHTYWISAALVPRTGPGGVDLGSFTFDGQPINVTGDMVYGVPPIESAHQAFDEHDLGSHDIFETFFTEFSFTFDPANRADFRDTSRYAGAGPTLNPSGEMYFAAFTVNTLGLPDGYAIHFDLYNDRFKEGDRDVHTWAPFENDAQSPLQRVPEPGTILLAGLGLALLGLLGQRRRHAGQTR